jgi:hypothetical protein
MFHTFDRLHLITSILVCNTCIIKDRGEELWKDVKIRLMSWIHEDAQGLVLGCWELGLPWCLLMKGIG